MCFIIWLDWHNYNHAGENVNFAIAITRPTSRICLRQHIVYDYKHLEDKYSSVDQRVQGHTHSQVFPQETQREILILNKEIVQKHARF